MQIGDAEPVRSLNQANVAVTSPMDAARFEQLLRISQLSWVVEHEGRVVAFLIGMTDGADYDNGNYRWFAERLKRFVYIDRVVVSDACRGQGIGRLLYAELFGWAEQTGQLAVCAEIDIEPPNEGSLRFHHHAGFVQVGTRELESGKRVSMQLRDPTNKLPS